MMIKRGMEVVLKQALDRRPVVALLGPRQAGKTTLAHIIASGRPSLYLDLESPADRFKLSDPLPFLSRHKDKLLILDEIQRAPDLFMTLRGVIDEGIRKGRKSGQFLILGSASGDLLKQSGESLAGRISYLEMSGFNLLETGKKSLDRLWLCGGFPESFLSDSAEAGFEWREDFIKTYLERDIPQFGFRVSSEKMRRFWVMLAHLQGQPLNSSALAANLDLSGKSIKHYVDILTELLLVRRLSPWHSSLKKRLVKAPKIYIRDSGLLHALLGICNHEELLSHPVVGAGWEGFVIENIISALPKRAEVYFYRTAVGAEIDLVIKFSDKDLWAVEVKKGLSPKISRGFYQACEDIKAEERYIVYSGEDEIPLKGGVRCISLFQIMNRVAGFSPDRRRGPT